MARAPLVISLFLSVLCCIYADDHGTNAIQYTADNFAEEVGKKPHFIMFFAPWCGHCKRLAPTWDELAKKKNEDTEKTEVMIGKVDCTQDTALCSEYSVSGYPTLKFFKPTEDAVRYKGGRDIESLERFIKEQLSEADAEAEETKEEKPAVPEPKSGLVELDGSNFAKHTEKGMHFIKFYAPWCGHCQRLAPTWEELAKTYEHEESISIAKLDCTKDRQICQDNGVKGYPTLLWFVDGQKVEKFSGGRDHESLKTFVSTMKAKAREGQEATDEKVPEMKEKEKEEEEDQEAAENVVDLTVETFDDEIANGITFVKFYAPWCGFCKRLAPTWEDLGKKFSNNRRVTIAKVDCTVDKDPCTKYEVRGYPTLILFKNGEKLGSHDGNRDLETLYDYVNDEYLKAEKHDEL